MPIRIEYNPVAAIADAGITAGLGQYRQRQQAMALQQRQLEQQNEQFQQGLAARIWQQQQDAIAQQNSQMFQAAKQAQILGWERGNQVADQGVRREQQVADNQQRRGFEVEDIKNQERVADERQQAALDWNWGTSNVTAMEADTNKTMAGYENQRQYMNDEGKRLLGDLTGKLRAIQKQRPALRPAQYGELLGQFREDVQRAGLEARIQRPQTIAERIPAETHREEVLDENGEFMGWNVWSGVVRNGQSTLTSKFIPKAKENTTADAKLDSMKPDSFEGLYANRETFNADFTATQKELIASSKAASEKGGTPAAAVTQADVVAAMKAKFDAWKSIQPKNEEQQSADQRLAENQQPEAVPQEQAPDPRLVLAYNRMQARMRDGSLSWTHDENGKGNAIQQSIADRWRLGDKSGAHVTPASVPKKPVNIQDAPKQRREILESVLPKPASIEEAMKLPPGTRFIGPDGVIRKVPGG